MSKRAVPPPHFQTEAQCSQAASICLLSLGVGQPGEGQPLQDQQDPRG